MHGLDTETTTRSAPCRDDAALLVALGEQDAEELGSFRTGFVHHSIRNKRITKVSCKIVSQCNDNKKHPWQRCVVSPCDPWEKSVGKEAKLLKWANVTAL